DEKLLRSILGNLLSNAIKYSPGNTQVDFYLIFEERVFPKLSSLTWLVSLPNHTLQEIKSIILINTFANFPNIGLKTNKIVTISIGFQGFGNSIALCNRFCQCVTPIFLFYLIKIIFIN
ncbi:ATP-binding protein, partial [Cronbergia sp. UHCC 0137]